MEQGVNPGLKKLPLVVVSQALKPAKRQPRQFNLIGLEL